MKAHLRLVVGSEKGRENPFDAQLERMEQVRWHLSRAAELARSAKVPIALFVTMARELFIESKFRA